MSTQKQKNSKKTEGSGEWIEVYQSGAWRDLNGNTSNNGHHAGRVTNRQRLEFLFFEFMNKAMASVDEQELERLYSTISVLLDRLDEKARYAVVNSQYLVVMKTKANAGVYTPQFAGSYHSLLPMMMRHLLHCIDLDNGRLVEQWKRIMSMLMQKGGLNPMLLTAQMVTANADSPVLFHGYQNSKLMLSYFAYQSELRKEAHFEAMLGVLAQFDGDKYHLLTHFMSQPPILTISFNDKLGTINGCDDIDGKCYVFGDLFRSFNDALLSPQRVLQMMRECPQSPFLRFISLKRMASHNNLIYDHCRFLDACRIRVNQQFVDTLTSYIECQYDALQHMHADKRLVYLFFAYKLYANYRESLLDALHHLYSSTHSCAAKPVLPAHIVHSIVFEYCLDDISYLYSKQERKRNESSSGVSTSCSMTSVHHTKWFYIFLYALDSFNCAFQQWIYDHILRTLSEKRRSAIERYIAKRAWYRSFVVKSYENNEVTMWMLSLNHNKIEHEKLYGLLKNNAADSVDNLRTIIDKFLTAEFEPDIVWKDIWSALIIFSRYTFDDALIQDTFLKMVQHFCIDFKRINQHLLTSLNAIIERWPHYVELVHNKAERTANCKRFLLFMHRHPKIHVSFEHLLLSICPNAKYQVLQIVLDLQLVDYTKCKQLDIVNQIWTLIEQARNTVIQHYRKQQQLQLQQPHTQLNVRQQHQMMIMFDKELNETSAIFQEWVNKNEGKTDKECSLNFRGWNFETSFDTAATQ